MDERHRNGLVGVALVGVGDGGRIQKAQERAFVALHTRGLLFIEGGAQHLFGNARHDTDILQFVVRRIDQIHPAVLLECLEAVDLSVFLRLEKFQ